MLPYERMCYNAELRFHNLGRWQIFVKMRKCSNKVRITCTTIGFQCDHRSVRVVARAANGSGQKVGFLNAGSSGYFFNGCRHVQEKRFKHYSKKAWLLQSHDQDFNCNFPFLIVSPCHTMSAISLFL